MNTTPTLASTQEAAAQLLAELPSEPWATDAAPYWYGRMRGIAELVVRIPPQGGAS